MLREQHALHVPIRPRVPSPRSRIALIPSVWVGYGLTMTDFAVACLWVCVAAAVVTAVVSARSMRLARAAATVMAAGSVIPTAVLARALWNLDLSITYVADHARAGIPGPYRLSGLWGGASGSLLLFTCMVAVAVAALTCAQPNASARCAALWGSLSVAVLAVAVLGTANPFRRLAIPAIDGTGMQPILEHPAMLYHPPLLYLGLVSTIVPFLIAVAAPFGSSRGKLPLPESAPPDYSRDDCQPAAAAPPAAAPRREPETGSAAEASRLHDNQPAAASGRTELRDYHRQGGQRRELAASGRTRRTELRFWLGLSLGLLTAGLATGSNWAYVELGWGGFWGWDPVENGILAAWLAVLAALHAVGLPGRGRVVRIACGLPWILVLVAASVTRAGIGGSVHAFADDERVAWILAGLALLAAVVLGSGRGDWPSRRGRCLQLRAAAVSEAGKRPATLRTGFARRAIPAAELPEPGTQPAAPRTRRHPPLRLRVVCAVLSAAAAAIVLIGVLYPIPAPGEPLVTGLYYATLLAPLAIVGLLGAAAAVADGRTAVRAAAGAAGAVVGMAAAAAVGAHTPFALCVAAGVGAMLVSAARCLRSRAPGRWPMRIGHLGFAVLLVGVAGSTLAERMTVGLAVGEEVEIGGRSFRHMGVEIAEGPAPGSDAVIGTVEVRESGNLVTVLRPSLVAFPDRSVLLAETALHSRPGRDIQAVLRNATDAQLALYDLSVAPLILWVWGGAVLMAGAGLMAAFNTASGNRRQRQRTL